MGRLRSILALIVMTVLTAASNYCEAATPMTISQVGSGSYSISTIDLPEAAGMEMVIKYDANFLETPVVQPGALIPAGSLFEVNIASVGTIRIGIAARIIKGTGELVSLAFKVKKKSPPVPIVLPPSVVSTEGTLLAVNSSASPVPTQDSSTESKNTGNQAANQTASISTSTSSSTTSQTTAQTATTVGSVLLNPDSGTVATMPRDDSHREPAIPDSGSSHVAVAQSVEDKSVSAAPSSPTLLPAPSIPAATRENAGSTLKSNQSALDRFSTYKGARTLSKLSSLFDAGALRAVGIIQTPAIVVSDGKSRVVITIDLGKETEATSFSLKGANQKSLKRVADGKWELEALPQKGKFDVRLSVLLKGERVEIPLVVVPPLSQAFAREFDSMTEAAVDALLAKPLKSNKPAYDVNADAKQDYIDDYILVGHWLLKKQRSANGTAKKPAAAHN